MNSLKSYAKRLLTSCLAFVSGGKVEDGFLLTTRCCVSPTEFLLPVVQGELAIVLGMGGAEAR